MKKVLVVGASAGTGRAVVERLAAEGHAVTALSRSLVEATEPNVRWVRGDVLEPATLDAAVRGQDAVIVTLGIRENPLRVRLLGPARTPMDVRSAGTRHVIEAMARHGVRRLVVQSSYGVGETRGRLGFGDALFFSLLLAPQIRDTEEQEHVVRESGLDWVLAQPVHLTDGAEDDMPFWSREGETAGWRVSRKSVARFLAQAAVSEELSRACVALSGAARSTVDRQDAVHMLTEC